MTFPSSKTFQVPSKVNSSEVFTIVVGTDAKSITLSFHRDQVFLSGEIFYCPKKLNNDLKRDIRYSILEYTDKKNADSIIKSISESVKNR